MINVNKIIGINYDVENQLKDVEEPVLIITGAWETNCDPQGSFDMQLLIHH